MKFFCETCDSVQGVFEVNQFDPINGPCLLCWNCKQKIFEDDLY